MFEVARDFRPCILFIDEIDALCVDREASSGGGGGGGGESVKLIAEFLQQMDGVVKDCMKDVLLVGATNLPWNIDSAVRRRFNRKIYVPLPTFHDRYEIIQHRMALNKDDVDHSILPEEMESLARDTEYYSGSDLVSLIKNAYERTMTEVLEAKYFRVSLERVSGERVLTPCDQYDQGAQPLTIEQLSDEKDFKAIRARGVTYQLLKETTKQCRPTVNAKTVTRYDVWAAEYGGASDK